ncbi:MAG: tetratricopeptide repeat protein [SAR324 cluster bacterium]|nr:tetratricopeptide repeat protein [SAR324 cluster bacterium]
MPRSTSLQKTFSYFTFFSANTIFPGVLTLIALSLLAYYPATQAEFIIDDTPFYIEDPVMNQSDGIFKIWLNPRENNDIWPYIPITRTSFWIERQLVGLNFQVSHLINIGLHIITAFFLWLCLRYLHVRGAWLIGMIFVLHPIHVQSVAWIAERKNVVAGVFYILTVWSYFHFEKKKHWPWYVLTLGLFLCSLLSKSSTIMLPVLFIFCRLWNRSRWDKIDVIQLVPFFLLSLLMGYVRIWFEINSFDATGINYGWTFVERLLIAGHVPFFYLTKIFFPYPLLFTYHKWPIDAAQVSMYLPLVSIIVVGTILFWKYFSWGRSLFLALGAFLISLFPVLSFFNNSWTQFSFVADHWVHLPSIPVLILLVQGIFYAVGCIKENAWARYVQSGIYVMLFIILLGLTWNQTQYYKNNKVLWESTLAHYPDAWMAHQELGREYMADGDNQLALRHLNKAIQLKNDRPDAYINRGVAYFILEQYPRAIQNFNQALQLNNEMVKAYYNRGKSYAKLHQYKKALADFTQILVLDPQFAEAYNNRGTIYLDLKQYSQALQEFNQALQLNPQLKEVYHNRGLVHISLGKYTQAIDDFNQVLQLDPQVVESLYSRGNAYLQLHQYEQAMGSYNEALKLNPQYVPAYNNRGYLHIISGNTKQACTNWMQACQLGECQYYQQAQRKQDCP